MHKGRAREGRGLIVCGLSCRQQQPYRAMENNPSIDSKKFPVLVAFGKTVRNFRKMQGFSQESFAHYCGLDRSYMGGVERGERNITLMNMERIICSLQLKPSEFFAALDDYFLTLSTPGPRNRISAFGPQTSSLQKPDRKTPFS